MVIIPAKVIVARQENSSGGIRVKREPQYRVELESVTPDELETEKSSSGQHTHTPSRRAFLKAAGAATVVSVASAAIGLEPILCGNGSTAEAQEFETAAASASKASIHAAAVKRRNQAFNYRVRTAREEFHVPLPDHTSNGDETLYPNFIGNYSKGLPHDAHGEVVSSAYATFLTAVDKGKASDFNAIPLGGTVLLVDPQAGLAFDLEGTDSHQLAEPPSPALASAQRADEMVENYWQALLRDVPFSQYETGATTAAISDLNSLTDFPVRNGVVTAQNLFRANFPGQDLGPYISQFFLPALNFGAGRVVQQWTTYMPGLDYLTDFASYLNCQNGIGPFVKNSADPTPRYLRDGRGTGAWVHVDVLYQAYFGAMLYLLQIGTAFNPGNPYRSPNPASVNQTGFGTFGAPGIQALMTEVASRGLKAQWFQKWYVHRALRPEAYGGLVHLTKTGTKLYPLHADVLNSSALPQVFDKNGTYLLPMAFPEGCPQHPSYGSGHATVAGACITILKAFFDETVVLPNPVVPSDDGLSLLPYTGTDVGQLTVGVELNKLASNVVFARNIAGVHWRSDAEEAMKLGEQVAISILRDQKACYNETFSGYSFTTLDGTRITV